MPPPKTQFEVIVRNAGEENMRLAEFVRYEDAKAFARTIEGRFAYVRVSPIEPNLEPEPLRLIINLNGKTLAQAEAMLTRMERIADQFEPYIDDVAGTDR